MDGIPNVVVRRFGFYAYVGIGQSVNPTENEAMSYQFALQYATERGDKATVEPYAGADMLFKCQAYMTVLGAYIA